MPFSPTILFLRIYHHVDYSPQAKFSSDPNWTRHICFCIVSGCFPQQWSWTLETKTVQPTKPKIFINTIHPFTESWPTSVLEKRTSIDTKYRCSEQLFIIIKNWNQPKCLSFNRLMDKSAALYPYNGILTNNK